MLSTAIVLCAALASPQERPVQDRAVHHPAFEGLSKRWGQAMRDLGVPGMAVVVVERDRIVHLETFGERDVERGLPVTPDTMFYIASATKPFVAMGLVALVDDGKVDLDEPVVRYLPRFRLADEAATRAITVRDLLCHRPGIQSFPIVFLDAYTGEITEDRYYHFLESVRPSGEITYSNVHFTLAGRVIEALAGKPWKDFLDERIFTPAGMDHTTGYATWMYAQEDVAYPTLVREGGPELSPVRKTDEVMHAAGGLGTSIHDLGRWLILNLNGGAIDGEQVISPEGIAEMQRPQSVFEEPDGWLRRIFGFGLGWFQGEYRGHRYLQHGGGYVGASAQVCFLPDERIGVAVVANTDGPGQGICQGVSIDVLDLLLGDESGYDFFEGLAEQVAEMRARGDGRPKGPNPAESEGGLSLEPRAYTGVFTSEHFGTLRIALEEGRLVGRLGILALELVSTGPDAFTAYAPGALEAAGRFEPNAREEVAAVSFELDEGMRLRFER